MTYLQGITLLELSQNEKCLHTSLLEERIRKAETLFVFNTDTQKVFYSTAVRPLK